MTNSNAKKERLYEQKISDLRRQNARLAELRIEARYRAVLIRFLLDPSPTHRRRLAEFLALLEEYRDTL